MTNRGTFIKQIIGFLNQQTADITAPPQMSHLVIAESNLSLFYKLPHRYKGQVEQLILFESFL